MSRVRPRFHLAFPVDDLGHAKDFYTGVLECAVGRESERWVDFDFHGHQITAHLVDRVDEPGVNPVDGDAVPVRHFGAILPWDDWQQLAARLEGLGVDFLIKPRTRFAGDVGEQATMFLRDPAGNALEFKAFRDERQIFARD